LKHHATAAFWQAYESLPAHVQELADRNFEKLKSDSKHPSLHFKQARDGDNLIWFWIGSHAQYDKLLK
jgi:hypothetical protein